MVNVDADATAKNRGLWEMPTLDAVLMPGYDQTEET
jgi:hypothetical protein